MPTDSAFVIGQREQAEISAYYEIAKANKSLITLSELAELTAADATDEDFENAWRSNPFLASNFALQSGYVVSREPGEGDRVLMEEENRARARRNAELAAELADICGDRGVRLMAISGGNSYKSARSGDDIDLFCITGKDRMWLFMLKSLLLARFYRFSRKSPPFCFSYVMEEDAALSEFGGPRDALFARDALSAQVLVGGGFYRELLERAGWMKRYFPRLYSRRVSGVPSGEESPSRPGFAALNHFLYLTVGSYVRMKAAMLNRRYSSQGRTSAIFQPQIGRDHCIYESNRYRRLRRMYSDAGGAAGP